MDYSLILAYAVSDDEITEEDAAPRVFLGTTLNRSPPRNDSNLSTKCVHIWELRGRGKINAAPPLRRFHRSQVVNFPPKPSFPMLAVRGWKYFSIVAPNECRLQSVNLHLFPSSGNILWRGEEEGGRRECQAESIHAALKENNKHI